jgi:hypothetical protein
VWFLLPAYVNLVGAQAVPSCFLAFFLLTRSLSTGILHVMLASCPEMCCVIGMCGVLTGADWSIQISLLWQKKSWQV